MKANGRGKSGFTLVELLVVIGIIAVLIGILLPTLAKARESGNAIKCAAHMRAIGQGMAQYIVEYKQTYPAAYIYNGMALNVDANTQTPDKAVDGYVHWSSFIYGRKDAIRGNAVNKSANGLQTFMSESGWEMFTCPSIEHGGLAPTNTFAGNLDAGQQNDDGANTVDFQAARCAFTVNEAICPRNKFVTGFQSPPNARAYRFVRASQVRKSSSTILATEFNQDWHVVADTARDSTSSSDDTVCKSHRPIHGFKGIAGGLNVELIPPDAFANRPTIQRCTRDDLMLNPIYPDTKTAKTRLDWVGRNHFRKKDSRGYETGKSNFLYVDGHVETKQVAETLSPVFEWGEQFYSLSPNKDVLNQ